VVDSISRKENAAEIIEHIQIWRRASTAEITGKMIKEMKSDQRPATEGQLSAIQYYSSTSALGQSNTHPEPHQSLVSELPYHQNVTGVCSKITLLGPTVSCLNNPPGLS
jgi:hypothetical protein